MSASTPLITTISVGLCLAFLFGILANKVKISPLVGYLLAGIIVGPYTGGFYADPELTHQLAEFGVLLLMFGIGLHFSWKDLLSVKKIVIPGALLQMTAATIFGTILGKFMDWSIDTSVIFGISLATASTVVVLRNLQERNIIDKERHIAVGWLVVEDIAMVFALVLIPALGAILRGDKTAHYTDLSLLYLVAITLIKVISFIVVTLMVGRRVIPWLLAITARTGSRELFRLSILAIALGVAYVAASLFGVSLSLGAFFAGMIMSETDMSHQAAEESLPLRDAFAVLFFVSVGMLFNPFTIIHHFFPLMLTLVIVIIGNSSVAYAIMRIFRYNIKTSLIISCCMAQIGEFAFILANVANNLKIINSLAKDLIIGAAIISIILNPLVFKIGEKLRKYLEQKNINDPLDQDIITIIEEDKDENSLPSLAFKNHTIIIGFGVVGTKVFNSLLQHNEPIVVIDDSGKSLEFKQVKSDNISYIRGNGVKAEILKAANIEEAKLLIISMSHSFEAGQIIIEVRKANKDIIILAVAQYEAEAEYLLGTGANQVIISAEETANKLIKLVYEEQNTVTANVIAIS